jgi:hypothetical protein
VLTEVKEKQGEEAARRAFRAQRGLSLLLLALVSVLGVLTAPWLVELFAGGFKDSPGKFERTVTLTRWVFPYIFFVGSAALGVAALNTERRFVVTSFAHEQRAAAGAMGSAPRRPRGQVTRVGVDAVTHQRGDTMSAAAVSRVNHVPRQSMRRTSSGPAQARTEATSIAARRDRCAEIRAAQSLSPPGG